MAICITNPIEKDKFNKLVSVVGQKEAARDYFEQNMMVRTPSVVLKKIQERSISKEDNVFYSPEDFIIPESTEPLEDEDGSLLIEGIINKRNSLVSQAAIDDMSSRLGIPYSFITESQAISRGAGSANSFYRKAEVFFVLGKFTPESVFHEFMHPVIKSMAIDRPDLFNKLYNDTLVNDWGKTISNSVREDKYYKSQNESNIRQEIVVRALTYMNENAVDNRTLLDKFLYQIRQFLRSMFGRKINVAKLDMNTSLEDLIDMLNKSEEFELNKDFLKVDDALMMEKDYNTIVEGLNKKSAYTVQNIINEFRGIVKEQVSLMQKDRGVYTEISDDLINDENTGMLQQILKGMQEISTSIGSSKNILTVPMSDLSFDDPKVMYDRIEKFITTVASNEAVFDTYQKIIDNIGEVTDMSGVQIQQLDAISTIADKWNAYFTKQDLIATEDYYSNLFPTVIVKNKKTGELEEKYSPFRTIMLKLKDKSSLLKNAVDKKRFSVIAEVTYGLAKESSKEIEEFYEDKMALLLDKGAIREYRRVYWQYHGVTIEEQDTIDRLEKQMSNETGDFIINSDLQLLEKLRKRKSTGHEVTREGILSLLLNKGPDASFFNSFVEAYGDNQDKIAGPFFLFMHNELKEVGGNATKLQNEFLEGLEPLLKKAKVLWRTSIGEGHLGKYVGHRVNVGKKQQVGEILEEYKEIKPEISRLEEIIDWDEWQIQSNFSGQDKVLLELRLEISNANKKFNLFPTPENQELYRIAVAKEEQFQEDYMTREYIPEVYQANYLFKDELGIKAKAQRDKFFEEYNLLDEVKANSAVDLKSMDAMKKKFREYRYMYSLTDIYGNPKVGEDLAISERLIEYRELTKGFYEYRNIDGKFQQAYDAYIFSLENDPSTKFAPADDVARQVKVDEWMEHNTVVELTDEYFEIRTNAIDERSEILKPLTDVNSAIKDIGPMYKEIYALAKPSLDEQGHYDGNRLTEEVMSKIQAISQEIEDSRFHLYTTLGLTKAQLEDYTNILTFLSDNERYENPGDKKKIDNYRKIMDQGLTGPPFNLSLEDVERFKELDVILSNLTRSSPTRHYINTIEEMLDVESTKELFDDFLDQVGVDRDKGVVLTEGVIDQLLNPQYAEYLDAFMKKNNAFENWFLNNHFTGERVVPMADDGKKSAQNIYIKTAIWSYSAPKSTDFYKSFPLVDTAGNIVGVLEYENLPRVPNMQYKERVVKNEYVTKEEPIDRVDEKTGRLILANKSALNKSWLPRTMEDGAKNTRFINKDYMNIFNNDRNKWELINYVKTKWLKYQDNMEVNERNGISFPKMRFGKTEKYQTGYIFNRNYSSWSESLSKGRMFESMKRIFLRREDDLEFGMSSRKSQGETAKYKSLTRPVSGTYDLEFNEVSTNLFGSMHDYLYSVELYKKLRQINAYSNSLKDMVNHNAIPSKMRRWLKISKGVITLDANEKKSKRAWVLNNIIEQYFQGVELGGSDFMGKKTIAQIMNSISSKNSRKWFWGNAIASATNAAIGKAQMYQKTWDRRFPNLKNLGVGSYKASKTMALLGWSTYSKKVKPLQVQLLNVMNAIPDNVKKNVSETANRNIATDFSTGQLGYISRKNMQHQVEVQAFYGMLDKDKYRFQINGKGKKVSIDEAIHLVGPNIETIPGVPTEFSISYNSDGKIVLGKKVKEIMSIHENYLHKSIGMAGKTSEGELLSRNLYGKYAFSLFKWLPAMIMDRVAFRGSFRDLVKGRIRPRVNWHTRSVEYGRTIGAFDALRQFTNTGFKHVNYKEVSDALQVAIWFIMFMALAYVKKAITFNVGGTDQDPEDRSAEFSDFDPRAANMFTRLQDAIVLPNVPGIDDSRTANDAQPFEYEDYFKEQLLRLVIRVERENNTFMLTNLSSGGGLIPIVYNIARFKSPMQSGVLDDYAKFGTMVRVEFGRHPQDNIIKTTGGPYTWQKAGQHKWKKWYMDYRGVTGSLPDPSRGIKGESRNL